MWTKTEDELLKIGIQRAGTKNWAAVASFVKSKSSKQCHERFLLTFLQKDDWTDEQDEWLKKNAPIFNFMWSMIGSALNKSALLCEQRYNQLMSSNLPTHVPEEGQLAIDAPAEVAEEQNELLAEARERAVKPRLSRKQVRKELLRSRTSGVKSGPTEVVFQSEKKEIQSDSEDKAEVKSNMPEDSVSHESKELAGESEVAPEVSAEPRELSLKSSVEVFGKLPLNLDLSQSRFNIQFQASEPEKSAFSERQNQGKLNENEVDSLMDMNQKHKALFDPAIDALHDDSGYESAAAQLAENEEELDERQHEHRDKNSLVSQVSDSTRTPMKEMESNSMEISQSLERAKSTHTGDAPAVSGPREAQVSATPVNGAHTAMLNDLQLAFEQLQGCKSLLQELQQKTSRRPLHRPGPGIKRSRVEYSIAECPMVLESRAQQQKIQRLENDLKNLAQSDA